MQPIIVFSHLRWDFVWQRPQHLISRIARQHPVYFIEEPVTSPGCARLEVKTRAPQLHVCTPYLPNEARGFDDGQTGSLRELLAELVEVRGLEHSIAWLYTPMAFSLLEALRPQLVLYDCMDELSLFRNAPRELLLRERALLKSADLIFTGGVSLYRAKRSLGRSVHCFPSSVEREHFQQSRDARIDHPEQCNLSHPRLGFCGVIDERLDIELLAAVADAHPEWSLVMVGPVVKIDPGTLPVRHNITYLGQRDYAELPRFLAGWDVCLLPFALNDSTRFISPTKTLEYMAAEKPIVSTPITDVVEAYADIVHVANGTAAFVAQCEAALAMTESERIPRTQRMRAVIQQTSWDATAQQMQSLIAETLDARRARTSQASSSGGPPSRERIEPPMPRPRGLVS